MDKIKAIGIVRPVDELGRVVIPKELRKVLNINRKDGMELFVKDDFILLRKYNPACIFCGSAENVKPFGKALICESCRDKIIKGEDIQL